MDTGRGPGVGEEGRSGGAAMALTRTCFFCVFGFGRGSGFFFAGGGGVSGGFLFLGCFVVRARAARLGRRARLPWRRARRHWGQKATRREGPPGERGPPGGAARTLCASGAGAAAAAAALRGGGASAALSPRLSSAAPRGARRGKRGGDRGRARSPAGECARGHGDLAPPREREKRGRERGGSSLSLSPAGEPISARAGGRRVALNAPTGGGGAASRAVSRPPRGGAPLGPWGLAVAVFGPAGGLGRRWRSEGVPLRARRGQAIGARAVRGGGGGAGERREGGGAEGERALLPSPAPRCLRYLPLLRSREQSHGRRQLTVRERPARPSRGADEEGRDCVFGFLGGRGRGRGGQEKPSVCEHLNAPRARNWILFRTADQPSSCVASVVHSPRGPRRPSAPAFRACWRREEEEGVSLRSLASFALCLRACRRGREGAALNRSLRDHGWGSARAIGWGMGEG